MTENVVPLRPDVSGRSPPCDLDAEGVVLSTLLQYCETTFDRVYTLLKPEHFYADANRRIFDTIITLQLASKQVDAVAVATELRNQGRLAQVGGTPYLATLSEHQPASAYIEQHAQSIISKWKVRQVLSIGQIIVAEGYGAIGNEQEWIEKLEQGLSELAHHDRVGTMEHLAQAGFTEIQRLYQARERGQLTTGLSTGLVDLDDILNGLQDGDLNIIAGRPGMGKCLGKGTLVLKYDGSTVPVESIQVNDLLMGPDSKPRRVQSVTRDSGQLYRIQPKKGAPWVCNWCHVLTLQDSYTGTIIDVPLDRYLERSGKFKHRQKLFSVPVEFAAQQAPEIDPYILGIWLGDGTKSLRGIYVSKPDQEIEDAMRVFAAQQGLRFVVRVPNSRCPTWGVVGERGKPNRILDLFRAWFRRELRIPEHYRCGSRQTRLQLLAGLLDTDGHLRFGGFEFVQKNPALARDTAFVARSLGFKVVETTKVVLGATYIRLSISGDLSAVPTRITRKRAPVRRQIKDPLRTGFSVTPIGAGDYFGFELDGDGRFLLGDFTVTHNTSLVTTLINNVATPRRGLLPEGVFLWSGEMPRAQVALRLVCSHAGIDLAGVRKHGPSQEQYKLLVDAVASLQHYPIWIDDQPGRTVLEIRAISKKLNREIQNGTTPCKARKLSLVCVDYLQLMKGRRESGGSREQEIASLSLDLKGLAKELNLPVCALSQLNRAVENRSSKDKRPQLSDLRESGAIENDADNVWLLYRRGYYDKSELGGETEIIIGKQRNGRTGTAFVYFDAEKMVFKNLDRSAGDITNWEPR